MFYTHISTMLDACYEELIQSSDKQIQKAIKMVKKTLPSDEVELFIKMFIKISISAVLKDEVPEENITDFIAEHLVQSIQGIAEYKKSYVLKVELEGLENEVNRVLEIPSSVTVADLAYAVLASFNAEATHLFSVRNKEVDFVCEYDENDDDNPYASLVPLIALDLRKRSKLSVWYDYGENYIFNIEVLEVKKNNEMTDLGILKNLDGKGFGIWEDSHYAMDLFYTNKDEFHAFLSENGLPESFFPVDETFDLDDSNEELIDNFWTVKEAYEGVITDEELN